MAQEDLSSRMCGECVSVGDAVCFLHAWGITEEFQLVVKHWDTLLLRYHFHIVIKILSLWGSLFWQMCAVWYGILFKSDSRYKEIRTFHKKKYSNEPK